jgi:hypothetical protein
MAKLHEVLAVDQDLQREATKVLDEAVNTFTKKQGLFIGMEKELKMYDDSRAQEEAAGGESLPLNYTVGEKLQYVEDFLIKSIDVVAQKEATNQYAKADLIIDGFKAPLALDVPATLLLSIENKLAYWRKMFSAIPTLPPSKEWKEDNATREGAYISTGKDVALKTEKIIEPQILVPATDKHPAQVEKLTKNLAVGEYRSKHWSGAISPGDKSRLLLRLDTLLAAVKKARMRANEAAVIHFNIGTQLFDYIHGRTT